MHYTYKIKIIASQMMPPMKEVEYLNKFAELFGRIERKLYVDLVFKGGTKSNLKKGYCSKYNITARQYNSIYCQADGKIKAVKELKVMEQNKLSEKIEKLEKVLEKLSAKKGAIYKKLNLINQKHPAFSTILESYRKIKFSIHQKKRKLNILKHKLEKVNKAVTTGIIRLCFGSKNLFRKQFNLQENGYASHEDWLKDWKNNRSNQFTCLGSKDESFGNQNCQYTHDNRIILRTADTLKENFGEFIIFNNINFKYGQKNIDRCKESYLGTTRGGKPQKYYMGAMTHRFYRTKHGWYILTTVDVDDAKITSSTLQGALGVDFNVNFLSLCLVDRFGNPLKEDVLEYEMYNKSSEKIDVMLQDAVCNIVKTGKTLNVDICIEKLSLENKKTFLANKSAKYSRMLSSFPYRKYMSFMEAKCLREGVRLRIINPAYTSIVGQFKYMKRYGLSSHGSAACVIARKGMGFKERCTAENFILKCKPTFKVNTSNFKKWQTVYKIIKKKFSFNERIELLKQGMI